jgi:hypothetical protein
MKFIATIWTWICANPDIFAAIFGSAWFMNSVLTPLFRKIPPQSILLFLRFLVGIIDKIQPANFARHADNAANALKDAESGKPVTRATIEDKGDVKTNIEDATKVAVAAAQTEAKP